MSKTRLTRLLKSGPIRCLVSIAILTMPLGGCETAIFRYACPTLKQYPKEFQTKAADEAAKTGPATKQLVSDYGQLRDACRAMEATK